MSIDREGKTSAPDADPARPTAVLDTQVVLDWLVFDDPSAQPLAEAVTAGRIVWLACAHMREELAHVLQRPLFACRVPSADAVLERFDRWVRPCPAPAPVAALTCTDRADQVFVDLAVAERACWLFTRDRALLALARRAAAAPWRLHIVPPARWDPALPGAAAAAPATAARRAQLGLM